MEGSTTSRRKFLGAAGATGVAIGAAVWGANTAEAAVPDQGSRAQNPAAPRSFAAGRYALDLGGIKAGWVQDVEGGHAVADVVNEKLGPDYIVHKHLAGVKYEDITMQIGLGMSKSVYDWVSASWSMNYQRKNGSIVAADFNLNAKSEREFFNALITETTIPACDASSKDPAFLTVKFSPEYTRVKKTSGKVELATTKQKAWLPSNFRLQIDGLDCTRVSKIEALTVKQKVVENPVGELRDYQREPGTLEFPNLVITTAQSNAQSWYDWHDDFVIKGNNGQANEKTGSLVFLTPDLKTELVKVTFSGLGIFAESDDILDTDDEVGKVTFSLYCEQMTVTFIGGGGTPQPTPTPAP